MSTPNTPPSHPQLSDSDIIAACNQKRSVDGNNYSTLVYPSHASPVAFIKYGPEDFGVEGESRNQAFAFESLNKLPQQERESIYVPEIYRVIKSGRIVYIVMEYVRGKTLAELWSDHPSDDRLQREYSQITKAIRLFLSFNIPDQAPPAPAGGGSIKHPIFKDTIASLKYESVDQLQKHLTRVANLPSNNNNLTIDFTGEELCFCFSDLFEGNFIFTETGRLYVVDYQHAALLPTSFMTYALDQHRHVCTVIKDSFDLPQDNLVAMRVAGYYFMISTRRVGIDISKEEQEERRARREEWKRKRATALAWPPGVPLPLPLPRAGGR